ncbi:MAG: SDR family oxidoreductase [Pseudomonadota bacterium]
MSVAGMKILVTGASSGIGAHVAAFLAGAGATVVAAARRMDNLKMLGENVDGHIIPVELDVGDPESVKTCVSKAADAMGGLNGLFNNAGIAWGGHALKMSEEDWTRVIDINVNGVFRVATACAPVMAESGGGAILNTASVLSFRPGEKVAAYATSKAAVTHLTKSLALEWAKMGVRVNAIAPGYFPTEMTNPFLATEKGQELTQNVPMGRFGVLHELDGPVELLLGSRGSFITGATLPVDGGHLCQSV